ncbi:hypothetical protein D3C84_832810 [compost metagenome]
MQLFGGVEIGEQGFFRRDRAFGLGQVGAVVPRIETDQHIAGLDLLVVGHQHFFDVTRHFRPDHRHVAADVGVVGFLDEPAIGPPVRGIHAGQHQRGDAQCRQEQAFEQRLASVHRDGKVGLYGGHAGHEEVTCGFNYARNMMRVIFSRK